MSAQFGIWKFDAEPVEPKLLQEAATLLSPHGPDGNTVHSRDNVGIVYSAFHTTEEARRELQPHILRSGIVMTWDGRLDNREELIRELPKLALTDSTDVEIVAFAFEQWGARCFVKLTGDWAVSVWSPSDKMLLLATDYMGSRRLYYCLTRGGAMWCTHLDPVVLLSRTSFTVNNEYVAGYLSLYPAAHLTPY